MEPAKINEIFENHILIDGSLSGLSSSAGLILFADSQDSPIMLLTAANIRRTVKNKLIDPSTEFALSKAEGSIKKASKKADLKSITAKIYYKTCPCRFRLAITHWQAVRKIFAQNYKDYITFVWPAYMQTNLSEKIPSFSITRKPVFKDGEKILGPLPGQKKASVFLKALEDAFRLCKRNDLVNNPRAAKSCPYIQMDACCGVCSGKISPQDYQTVIKNAFEAGINPKKTTEELQQQMQTASKELNFEKAAELKRKIEKLSVLTKQVYPHINLANICTCSKSSAKTEGLHQESQKQDFQTNRHSGKIGVGAYRWTGDLEKLKIVHMDKSAKIKIEGVKGKKQTYAVFVISFFGVIDLGDFLLDDIDSIVEAINKAIENLPADTGDTEEPSFAPAASCEARAGEGRSAEQFSIVSFFLYRSKPTGLWMEATGGINKEVLQEFNI